MTNEEAIAMVSAIQSKAANDGNFDIDECINAAAALIEVGIVIDNDGMYSPNLKRLQECPEDVRAFIAGMLVSNKIEADEI